MGWKTDIEIIKTIFVIVGCLVYDLIEELITLAICLGGVLNEIISIQTKNV